MFRETHVWQIDKDKRAIVRRSDTTPESMGYWEWVILAGSQGDNGVPLYHLDEPILGLEDALQNCRNFVENGFRSMPLTEENKRALIYGIGRLINYANSDAYMVVQRWIRQGDLSPEDWSRLDDWLGEAEAEERKNQ